MGVRGAPSLSKRPHSEKQVLGRVIQHWLVRKKQERRGSHFFALPLITRSSKRSRFLPGAIKPFSSRAFTVLRLSRVISLPYPSTGAERPPICNTVQAFEVQGLIVPAKGRDTLTLVWSIRGKAKK